MNAKRIAAIIGIVLLVGMYITALVMALLDYPGKGQMFIGCIVGTIMIPGLIYLYIGFYGLITNKKTMASFRKDEEEKGATIGDNSVK